MYSLPTEFPGDTLPEAILEASLPGGKRRAGRFFLRFARWRATSAASAAGEQRHSSSSRRSSQLASVCPSQLACHKRFTESDSLLGRSSSEHHRGTREHEESRGRSTEFRQFLPAGVSPNNRIALRIIVTLRSRLLATRATCRTNLLSSVCRSSVRLRNFDNENRNTLYEFDLREFRPFLERDRTFDN